MSANSAPIYSRAPDVQWVGYLLTGNTTTDLTAGTSYLIFTADATNGGYVQKCRLRPSPGGNTTATVCRLWINNGSATGTATNNTLYTELTLPATTATFGAATPEYEIALNFALPANYRIYATLGTSTANGWAATIIGGKY